MKPLALQNQLDNSVWAIAPNEFLSFKNSIEQLMKSEAYSSDTSEDTDDQDCCCVNGICCICVNGVLVRGSGLPECVCDMLGITDLDYLDEDLIEARDNVDCEKIILLFNSPGGTCHAHSTALLIQQITQNKDVIGYVNAMCCSAAYELAAMCSELYCSETAWLGFIGTIYTRADYTGANKQDGVSYTFVTSSPKKLYLNTDTTMTEEEKQWIEEAVMYNYEIFKADVLSNRDIAEECLDSSIFIGQQAVENNLADGIVNNMDDLFKNSSSVSLVSEYL